jgi:hypothetical protein
VAPPLRRPQDLVGVGLYDRTPLPDRSRGERLVDKAAQPAVPIAVRAHHLRHPDVGRRPGIDERPQRIGGRAGAAEYRIPQHGLAGLVVQNEPGTARAADDRRGLSQLVQQVVRAALHRVVGEVGRGQMVRFDPAGGHRLVHPVTFSRGQ